jgi:hypothetical protein
MKKKKKKFPNKKKRERKIKNQKNPRDKGKE